MVVINTHIINWSVFGLCILSGSMGALMLFIVVYIPLMALIKLNFEVGELSRLAVAQRTSVINVWGTDVKVTNTDDSSADLSVGMSMGEP